MRADRTGGFHIETIALPGALRGIGLGSKLLDLAEMKRAVGSAMLPDTQAFQAKSFYERHGLMFSARLMAPSYIILAFSRRNR